MRKWLIFSIAGVVLSGCATTAENPWDGLTVDTDPAATSVDCGQFPLPSEVIGNAIVYDQAGVNDLEAYRACSEANKGIVDAHAAQIGHLKVARAALVDPGQSQRNIAQMRQEMLGDERRHNFYEKFGLYAVIIGLGLSL